MSGELISTHGLVVGYEAPVVGPFDLTVMPGEVVGLAGPNGSGKSTLLKALANHVRVFAGQVQRQPGIQLGWLQQQSERLPEMPFNGWEYLRFAGAREAPPPHLAQWLPQRVDALSGGQFQLLCVWSVLGSDAELLLLDEPTTNLDLEGEQIPCRVLGRDQGERGVLLVSHDHAFLKGVCSRVLELSP